MNVVDRIIGTAIPIQEGTVIVINSDGTAPSGSTEQDIPPEAREVLKKLQGQPKGDPNGPGKGKYRFKIHRDQDGNISAVDVDTD